MIATSFSCPISRINKLAKSGSERSTASSEAAAETADSRASVESSAGHSTEACSSCESSSEQ